MLQQTRVFLPLTLLLVLDAAVMLLGPEHAGANCCRPPPCYFLWDYYCYHCTQCSLFHDHDCSVHFAADVYVPTTAIIKQPNKTYTCKVRGEGRYGYMTIINLLTRGNECARLASRAG